MATHFQHGIVLLPTASLGVVSVPFAVKVSKRFSNARVNERIGSFAPTLGVQFRYWQLNGWFDAHFQAFYGVAGAAELAQGGDEVATYLWGVGGGPGLVLGVIDLDFVLLNRRTFDSSDNVSVGGAFFFNINVASIASAAAGAIIANKK